MPEDIAAVRNLRNHYRQSQASLVNRMSEQLERGNQTDYTEGMRRMVDAEVKALDKYADEWVTGTLPKQYQDGFAGVYRYVGEQVPQQIIARNMPAIEVIMENAFGDLTDAHHYLGRAVNDQIRQASLESVAGSMAIGDTVPQAADVLKKRLSDMGMSAFQDKRGREIPLDAYATMVARSTTREATNLGTLQACRNIDNDLVTITDHAGACPVCRPYEGRVYSVTGNDRRYPALSQMFSGGYANIHPNCAHSIVPYVERFDSKAAETRRQSNRSFDTDPGSQAEKERYDREQAEKRRLRADQNQWQRYRITLGDKAPKTLTTFRRWKEAENEKWQEITTEYRRARRG